MSYFVGEFNLKGNHVMKLRMAVMGFRHGHIMGIYGAKREDLEIVGACEEDAKTRGELARAGKVKITHDNFRKMLDELDFEVLAVGDYYGRRGEIILEALKRGKHVICDKPICTQPGQIDEIKEIAQNGKLSVGCQFDLRSSGIFRALRNSIREGAIGEVHAVSFNGQHPLSYGSRPAWYFEDGKHGGTINDIAIHAIDAIPWMTGNRFVKIEAARNWNAGFPQVKHFKNAALMMLTMDNGCGVLGDVSYFAPDSFGYSLPQYWRFTLWGEGGMIEANIKDAVLYRNGEKEPRKIELLPQAEMFYLDCFLREIRGEGRDDDLTTGDVLTSSRATLLAQQAADQGLYEVALE